MAGKSQHGVSWIKGENCANHVKNLKLINNTDVFLLLQAPESKIRLIAMNSGSPCRVDMPLLPLNFSPKFD
jgi:hypothetical protein